jgi:hypothetical protein
MNWVGAIDLPCERGSVRIDHHNKKDGEQIRVDKEHSIMKYGMNHCKILSKTYLVPSHRVLSSAKGRAACPARGGLLQMWTMRV